MTEDQLREIEFLLAALDDSTATLENGACFTLDSDGEGLVFEVRCNTDGKHYLVIGLQK